MKNNNPFGFGFNNIPNQGFPQGQGFNNIPVQGFNNMPMMNQGGNNMGGYNPQQLQLLQQQQQQQKFQQQQQQQKFQQQSLNNMPMNYGSNNSYPNSGGNNMPMMNQGGNNMGGYNPLQGQNFQGQGNFGYQGGNNMGGYNPQQLQLLQQQQQQQKFQQQSLNNMPMNYGSNNSYPNPGGNNMPMMNQGGNIPMNQGYSPQGNIPMNMPIPNNFGFQQGQLPMNNMMQGLNQNNFGFPQGQGFNNKPMMPQQMNSMQVPNQNNFGFPQGQFAVAGQQAKSKTVDKEALRDTITEILTYTSPAAKYIVNQFYKNYDKKNQSKFSHKDKAALQDLSYKLHKLDIKAYNIFESGMQKAGVITHNIAKKPDYDSAHKDSTKGAKAHKIYDKLIEHQFKTNLHIVINQYYVNKTKYKAVAQEFLAKVNFNSGKELDIYEKYAFVKFFKKIESDSRTFLDKQLHSLTKKDYDMQKAYGKNMGLSSKYEWSVMDLFKVCLGDFFAYKKANQICNEELKKGLKPYLAEIIKDINYEGYFIIDAPLNALQTALSQNSGVKDKFSYAEKLAIAGYGKALKHGGGANFEKLQDYIDPVSGKEEVLESIIHKCTVDANLNSHNGSNDVEALGNDWLNETI